MTAWKDLPNARRIDWVITSLKQHPEIWEKAWHEAYNAARAGPPSSVLASVPHLHARDVVYNAGRNAAWEVAWEAAWETARDAALDAALRAAWDAASRGAAWAAARDAILVLIGYDDCAHLLDMTSDRLKMWAVLSEQPAAVLLLPAVIAREQISELNMA